MLTLYSFKNSVCAQKVRVTMVEKGLDWETKEVQLFKNEQYDPEYLKLNPKAVVPTLIHDGRAIIESTLICEYLDEVFPEPRLVPADPAAKAEMRLWSKAVDEGLFEGVREISFSAMFRERMRNMTEAERETRFYNVGDPARRDRYVSAYELGADSPYVFQAVAAYEKAFKNMETALDGRDWLVGEYSLADINIMPFTARLDYLTLLDVWTAERPRVRDWWARVQELPAFQAEISGRLSEDEFAAMAKHGAAIKPRIGELRAEHLAALH